MNWLIAKLESDARDELHSLMGMLELIADGPLAASQSNYLTACRMSADRLLRTIQNVSVLLSQEPYEAQVSDFDLHDIVEGVTSLMEPLAQRRELGLVCVIPPSVPSRVAGDREHLEDILSRLLDNAIRFTDRGGVELIVSASPKDGKTSIQFEIRDTGPGIPPDIIASLTSPTSEETVWQGLGLPIVRKFVSALGGELFITSRALGGTSVTVSLPFDNVADSAPRTTEDGERNVVVPLNILVAEDSDDSYYLLEAYLGARHRLCRAVHGADAIEMFKTGHYDLVFMDIHMPGVDGYSATRAIREWESRSSRARIPIVVLSSDSPKTQLHHGAKAGCSAYLTKPVSKADILNVLKRYSGTK